MYAASAMAARSLILSCVASLVMTLPVPAEPTGEDHTRVLPAWVHGTMALAALGMNIVTGVLALQSIAENVTLIDEIDEALPEDAGE